MKKGMIPLICMLLTLVFIIVALIGTWYTVSYEMNEENYYQNYGLTSAERKNPGEDDPKTESYAEMKEDYEDSDADAPSWIGVFDNAFYITIIALIVAIIALICILGMTFGFGNLKTMKMLGGIFGILTVVFCLVAPIYFMTAYPSEMYKDAPEEYGFWDEAEVDGTTYSLSPGFGWYLMIIGFVLSLVGALFIFMDKKSAIAAPPQ